MSDKHYQHNITEHANICAVFKLNHFLLQVTAYLHKDYNNLWLVHRHGDNECEERGLIYSYDISIGYY